MAIVVGRLAAHTPSFLRVFSSMFDATTSGGAHCVTNWGQSTSLSDRFYKEQIGRTAKQAVCPGMRNWMCPDTAFSETPDSNQIWLTSLQAALMAMRASKLSTQLSTRSTGPPVILPSLQVSKTLVRIDPWMVIDNNMMKYSTWFCSWSVGSCP